MADLDNSGVMQQSDVNALMNQTKQQLVAQFPYLANNTDFNSDLSDAFAKFVNQGVQVGSDYNDVYNKTVAPMVSKWSAKATQDTNKNWETQEQAALNIAKQTGSPTAAMQAFPNLLSPASKYRAEWVGRINKADEGPGKLSPQDAALLSATKDAYTEALKSGDTDTAADLKKQIVNFKPSLSRQSTLTPSPAVAPPAQPSGPGVAAPMGTSGYVNYNVPAGMRPQGSMFIGSPTPAQAAQLLQQWQNRTAAPPMSASLATPGPPPGIAPPPAAAPAGPAVAVTPAPAPAPRLQPVTMENSGLLGVGLNRLKNFMSNSPTVQQFLHGDDPQALRTYVAAHPELSPADKKILSDRANNLDFAKANTAQLVQGVKQLGSNIATSGQLAKDALVGTSGAALPLPPRAAAPPQAPAVPVNAISYLKQHPELADEFDQKYGQGAAETILGQ